MIMIVLFFVAYFKFLRLSPEEAVIARNNVTDNVKGLQATTSIYTIPDKIDKKSKFIVRNTGTLQDLLHRGENLVCETKDFSSTESDNNESSEFYINKDGKLRGKIITNSPDLNGKIIREVLIDNGVLYYWSEFDGEIYGAKISLDAISALGEGKSKVPLDFNSEISYECKFWNNEDKTIFSLPESVIFVDLEKSSNSAPEEGIIYEE